MVIIFRGTSGSGKSTLAELLKSTNFKFGEFEPASRPATEYCKTLWQYVVKSGRPVHSVSADDYFTINGEYKFEAKFLGAAHASCLRSFDSLVRDTNNNNIIVDNTNTTLAEFVPYAALANAYGHEMHIITLVVSPIEAWSRNKHSTPFANIVKQAYNLEKSIIEMPPWFPQQVFPTEMRH